MLKPDERSPLLELLRPPLDYRLDQAIGTSFSLDLVTALTVPLAFALFDREDKDGKPTADPLALLEALRRYGDRLTVFCQAGQIPPPDKYPSLMPWLEDSIYGVRPKDSTGAFHPKVWALRFTKPKATAADKVLYRVLCMSRNLTFDRCWDTVVALDGELTDRERAYSANRCLGEFFSGLPDLKSQRALSPARKKTIDQIADELLRVKFDLPDGFEGYRFWHGGMDGSAPLKCFAEAKQALVIAPFVSDSIIQKLTGAGIPTHLVSRLESLDALSLATLNTCHKTYTLATAAAIDETNSGTTATDENESLQGLHAKLFVTDRGWNASVLTGSFNATNSAFGRNVEFMVELIGKRSRFGVDAFLAQQKGETRFADLLCEYRPDAEAVKPDPVLKELDELLTSFRRDIIIREPLLRVSRDGDESFSLTLEFSKPLTLSAEITAHCRPITLQETAAKPLGTNTVFIGLGYPQLTPFMTIELSASRGSIERRQSFVMNLPLLDAPTDRLERALASALGNKDQLLRYILFMLSVEDDAGGPSIASLRALAADGTASNDAPVVHACLFETLLRALHRDPAQLDRVQKLIKDLERAPAGTDLLSAEFQAIWKPLWEARQRGVPQ